MKNSNQLVRKSVGSKKGGREMFGVVCRAKNIRNEIPLSANFSG